MTGFLIYAACCALFYVYAVYVLLSKKPAGIGVRERKRFKVKDVRGYNRDIAKLFFAYGTVLLLCGVPTILDLNPILVMMISAMGVSFASIALFLAAIKIEEKHRKKQ